MIPATFRSILYLHFFRGIKRLVHLETTLDEFIEVSISRNPGVRVDTWKSRRAYDHPLTLHFFIIYSISEHLDPQFLDQRYEVPGSWQKPCSCLRAGYRRDRQTDTIG